MFSYLFSEGSKSLVSNLTGSKFLGNFAFGIGSFIGQDLDRYFLTNNQSIISRKIDSFSLNQTISYGEDIPIIYGKTSISGNIIWIGEIKEDIKIYQQKYGAIFKRKVTQENYCYLADFAIAVCEGPAKITEILADGQKININDENIKIYSGTSEQLPDQKIESYLGKENTPAFRDLCYITFEKFPLNNQGSLPHFRFTVERDFKIINHNIQAIEFTKKENGFAFDQALVSKLPYLKTKDLKLNSGDPVPINYNLGDHKSFFVQEIERLNKEITQLEWIKIPIIWYNDNNKLVPGINEKEDNCKTIPYEWNVANYNKNTAKIVQYSTINDASLNNIYKYCQLIGLKLCIKLESDVPASDEEKLRIFNYYKTLNYAHAIDGGMHFPSYNMPEKKFYSEEKLNLFTGCNLHTMLQNIFSDKNSFSINCSKEHFYGIIIKNMTFYELLASVNLLMNIDFFTQDGKIHIKKLTHQKRNFPEFLKKETITYNENNYIISYPSISGKIEKYIVNNHQNKEYKEFFIPFYINSPADELKDLLTNLNPVQKISTYEAMYKIDNHLSYQAKYIEFLKDYRVRIYTF